MVSVVLLEEGKNIMFVLFTSTDKTAVRAVGYCRLLVLINQRGERES